MGVTGDSIDQHWNNLLQPARHDDLVTFLDPQTVPAVAAVLQEIDVARGAVLYSVGDEADGVYRVVSGQVKLQRSAPTAAEGLENVLTVVGRGQVFGSVSVFDAGPRDATAVALTPCKLRFIAREDALALVQTEPTFALAMLAHTSRRLRLAHNAVSALVLGDVPSKVARAITQLGARFGDRLSDGTIRVFHGLTQAELAAMIGASREAVNKAMADFAQRGWIEPRTRGFLIFDYDRVLRRAGDHAWEKRLDG
jgi:CRP/FNR family transcriptional regulator